MTEQYSFGEKLRLARERRGLSPEEAAKALCLNVDVIHALEKEQFDKLPSPVFVRGYIKNYASLLRLTINNPSSSAASSYAETSTPSFHASKSRESLSLIPRIFLKLINYVVMIALVFLVFIWWHERHHALEKTDTTNSVISMSVEKVPFGRLPVTHKLFPFYEKEDLMKDIFPGWPL